MTQPVRLIAATILALALGAGTVARGDQLPAWPHEQQAMLNQLEEDLLTLQRQMFKARQLHDTAALEGYSAQLAALQDKRRKLIDLTKGQLPSE